jgi:hypothetical protein
MNTDENLNKIKTCQYIEFFGFLFSSNLTRCRPGNFDMISIRQFLKSNIYSSTVSSLPPPPKKKKVSGRAYVTAKSHLFKKPLDTHVIISFSNVSLNMKNNQRMQ